MMKHSTKGDVSALQYDLRNGCGHSCIDSSLDYSYGLTPAEPNIPVVELLQHYKEHLDSFKVSSDRAL